jgi:hypothetical protein
MVYLNAREVRKAFHSRGCQVTPAALAVLDKQVGMIIGMAVAAAHPNKRVSDNAMANWRKAPQRGDAA